MRKRCARERNFFLSAQEIQDIGKRPKEAGMGCEVARLDGMGWGYGETEMRVKARWKDGEENVGLGRLESWLDDE